jgi:DNA polymerase sigma
VGRCTERWLDAQDPGDTENDASRSSYGIMEVRACFLNAYRALTSTSGLFESCPSFLARILLRDRRLEHHRSAIRDLYARSDGSSSSSSSSSSSADRKRTRDQWDQRDQRYRHDDDRSHHRHRRDHDEDERHHTDRYRPRPRTHHGNEAEGGHRRF